MSIYDIDYSQCINDLYPTNKRQPVMLSKIISLMTGVNFIQKLFNYFRNGALESNYSAVTVYTFGQMVNFQRSIYYRNEVVSGYIAGKDPTTKYWTLVLSDFIGASEKVYFGPGKMSFEYALNRIFQTTYRQPIGIAPPLSDIYIIKNETNQSQFYVGIDDAESSLVIKNDTEAVQFITLNDANSLATNFTIRVPNAVLTALNADVAKAKAIVSSVALRYKLSGYTFIVEGY